jgi:hypothetical protein
MEMMIGGVTMDEQLEAIEKQVGKRNFEAPPLHLWHPPLSGDIPIRIAADGTWYHEGGEIKREAIVHLFAAILRREDDGEYYLVTPGEKWRIEVDLHPLIATDVERSDSGLLQVTLNTGRTLTIDKDHPLFLEKSVGGVAVVKLEHGLSALFSRAAWYRLVAMAEDHGEGPTVVSGEYRFPLEADSL